MDGEVLVYLYRCRLRCSSPWAFPGLQSQPSEPPFLLLQIPGEESPGISLWFRPCSAGKKTSSMSPWNCVGPHHSASSVLPHHAAVSSYSSGYFLVS